MSDIETAEHLVLINKATTGIIDYMLERGPIAPSSELRHFVKQEMVELLAAIRLAAKLEGKREALGEICMALLSDRNASHQRDDWAPVLRRIQDKYSPTSKEASGG